MDEDGIRKILAVIIEDKPGDYHLSTGNAYPDAKHELGIKQRRKKATESGEVESKSVVISNNSQQHACVDEHARLLQVGDLPQLQIRAAVRGLVLRWYW